MNKFHVYSNLKKISNFCVLCSNFSKRVRVFYTVYYDNPFYQNYQNVYKEIKIFKIKISFAIPPRFLKKKKKVIKTTDFSNSVMFAYTFLFEILFGNT